MFDPNLVINVSFLQNGGSTFRAGINAHETSELFNHQRLYTRRFSETKHVTCVKILKDQVYKVCLAHLQRDGLKHQIFFCKLCKLKKAFKSIIVNSRSHIHVLIFLLMAPIYSYGCDNCARPRVSRKHCANKIKRHKMVICLISWAFSPSPTFLARLDPQRAGPAKYPSEKSFTRFGSTSESVTLTRAP
jgi:hypothetical protein